MPWAIITLIMFALLLIFLCIALPTLFIGKSNSASASYSYNGVVRLNGTNVDKNFKFISQKNQDEWVIRDIFNYKKDGYFIDLAATDGKKINNTYLLEKKLNWKGICIEPNEVYHNELNKNRNCIISYDVIDDYNDKKVKFRIDNGELGGIVDDNTDNNYKYRSKELKKAKIVEKNTATLESILDKYNSPKIIDYLSLDVEGAETRILERFPFDKYTFLTLTIERPTLKLEKLLFQNGYVFVKKSKKNGKDTFDSFYVHKSIPNYDNIKKEKYSPTPRKDW